MTPPAGTVDPMPPDLASSGQQASARTVYGPVTIHERVRNRWSGPFAHHQLQRPWPPRVTITCSPYGEYETRPGSELPDASGNGTWPDQIELTITDPRLTEPVIARAFEFSSAENTAFYAWRKAAPCPATDTAHRWEPGGYRNGCGTCRGCGLFAGDVIDLAAVGSVCAVCQQPTWWAHVKTTPGAVEDEQVDQPVLVCRDHNPPGSDDVLDLLDQHARTHATPSELAQAQLPAWMRRDVSAATIGGYLEAVRTGDRENRARYADQLRNHLADARARVVADLLTGTGPRIDPTSLTADPFAATGDPNAPTPPTR